EMSQYLSTGGFKWLSTKPLEATSLLMQKILLLKEKSNQGCCLEVKLSIPKELHPKFRNYPMCPERMKVPYDWYRSKQKEWIRKQHPDTEKLILTLQDKDHY
ncbi:1020_t:CDS:1, partial [Racocetra persica]